MFRLTIILKSPFFRSEKKDNICAMFCATHKSLTLGVSMLKIMYSGDPNLSFITILLLFFCKKDSPRFVATSPYVTFFHSILPASLLGLNWLSLEPLIIY